jgi:hypothetical protein
MTISFARSPAGIGALLAVATIPLHLLLTKTQSEQFAALLLAVIGAIYIGFSVQKGTRPQLATEVTVLPRDSLSRLWRLFGAIHGLFRLLMSCMDFGTTRITKV